MRYPSRVFFFPMRPSYVRSPKLLRGFVCVTERNYVIYREKWRLSLGTSAFGAGWWRAWLAAAQLGWVRVDWLPAITARWRIIIVLLFFRRFFCSRPHVPTVLQDHVIRPITKVKVIKKKKKNLHKTIDYWCADGCRYRLQTIDYRCADFSCLHAAWQFWTAVLFPVVKQRLELG